VKKLVLAAGGFAAISMALIGAGVASAQAPDVTGETYAKAQVILKQQGYTAMFGGSVGDQLPQSQCIVTDQKVLSTGTVQLRLDCKRPKGSDATAPVPGANGITTVTPTTVTATSPAVPPPPAG
jgi:hypothetical protein